MAEFLNDFFQSVQDETNLEVSFTAFKSCWKQKRLTHIFLIQYKEEPFHAFARELFDYVVDRLHHEWVSSPGQRDRVLAYGVFALYTLFRCQPFEDHKINDRVAIYLPLWTWQMMTFLAERFKAFHEQDAYEILLYLFQIEAFTFCLERPIDYRPQSSFPYPKNGQVFCNNEASQVTIAPATLWTSVDIPPLKHVRTEYEAALRQAGTGFGPEVTLDAKLRKELKSFEKYQTKVGKTRKKRQKEYLADAKMDYFYQKPAVLPPDKKKEYYEMCNRYDMADAHLPPIDGSPINMNAILASEHIRHPSPPRRRNRRSRGAVEDSAPAPDAPPSFTSQDNDEITGPPRRKKRKTSTSSSYPSKRRLRRDEKEESDSATNSTGMSAPTNLFGKRTVKEENLSPVEMDGFPNHAQSHQNGQHHIHPSNHQHMMNGDVDLEHPPSVSENGMMPPTVTDPPPEFDPSAMPFGFESFSGLPFDGTLNMNGGTNNNDSISMPPMNPPNLNIGLGGLHGYPMFGGFQPHSDLLLPNGTNGTNGVPADDDSSSESKRKSRKRLHSQVDDYHDPSSNGSGGGDVDEDGSQRESRNGSDSFGDVNSKGDVSMNGDLDLPGLHMSSQFMGFPGGDPSYHPFMAGLLTQTSDSLGSMSGSNGFPIGMPGMGDGTDKTGMYGIGDWNQNGSNSKPNGEDFGSMLGQLDSVLMKTMRYHGMEALDTLGGNHDFSLGSTNGMLGAGAFGETAPDNLGQLDSSYGANLRPPDPQQKKRRRIDHLPPHTLD